MKEIFPVGCSVRVLGSGAENLAVVVLPLSRAEREAGDFIARLGTPALLVEYPNGARVWTSARSVLKIG